MEIVKAEADLVEKIVAMSVRAFETDVGVGGAKGEYPPGFDSVEWYKQMAREGHLYQAMIGEKIVGAAIVFPDQAENCVYIGRIFIDSVYHRKERLFVNASATLEYEQYAEITGLKPSSIASPVILLSGAKKRMQAVM